MRYIVSFIFLFVTILSADEPDAVLKIEKSVDGRSKISIVSSTATISSKLEKINRLFVSDLKVSGHFLPDENITSKSYDTPAIALGGKSEYTLMYELTGNGGATLDIKLFKGNPKKQILHKNYSVTRLEKYPFLIHKAVSDINSAAKFPDINWINRYVVLSRYIGPKQTEIMLADYTFTYKKTIIKGGLNLFPKWADKNQRELFYSSYGNDILTLYKLNIYTGQKSKIVTSKGMLACSDVDSNGRLLLTMAPESQADIYLFSNGNLKKLTNFSGIDVGGKFADGGASVVFVSNRMGTPNIYKTSIDGANVVKIVNHGTNNSSCDAYNNQVVYSSKESRKSYNIYLTSTDGGQTRPLTSGGINQFPIFSHDGKVVMYIKRTQSGNSIGFVNISANVSQNFKMGLARIQSIDW
jgi:TolB protein